MLCYGLLRGCTRNLRQFIEVSGALKGIRYTPGVYRGGGGVLRVPGHGVYCCRDVGGVVFTTLYPG